MSHAIQANGYVAYIDFSAGPTSILFAERIRMQPPGITVGANNQNFIDSHCCSLFTISCAKRTCSCSGISIPQSFHVQPRKQN